MSLSRILYDVLQLKRNQWKSREELEKIQLKKLKAIVKHAYHHVPFYHKLYKKHHLKPEDIKTLKDIQKLPFITKKEARDSYPKNITAKGTDLKKCLIMTTTGSTGIPLKVVEDKNSILYSKAVYHYAFSEAGLKFRDKFVKICIPKDDFKRNLLVRLGLLRRQRLLINEPIEKNIELLRKIKPDAIYSFPSVLMLYSRELENRSFNEINPKLILTEGEMLASSARKSIETGFNSEVFDTYGATEFQHLGFECKMHEGLHAVSDVAVIEFIKDGEPVIAGEEGEIIITGLYNYAMPLIRYRIGDLGILSAEKCSCGRTYPLIKEITGRLNDFITLPSGRVIPWRSVNPCGVPGLNEFQVIQEKRGLLKVLVVEGKGFNESTAQKIESVIKKGCLGEKVKVKIKSVEKIPREKTGKLRAIISKVKQ